MASIISKLSVSQLQRAIAIRQQIERLQAELEAIASVTEAPVRRPYTRSEAARVAPGRKKWTMSPEARARIGAAQKARWAKKKAGK